MNQPTIPQKRQLANWITDYVSAVDSVLESPTNYNFWTAISVVSTVLKDRVWINRGTYKVLPNQYILLVGPPGIGKGNAIHLGTKFILEPVNKVPLANLVMDSITKAKLIDILAKGYPRINFNSNGHLLSSTEASCLIHVPELPNLLTNSNGDLTNFLTDVWSRTDFAYSTKNGGVQVVKDLCISILAACVPDFVKDINNTKGNIVSNGFTARTMFIFGKDKSKNIVWPKQFAGSVIADKLHNDLQLISRLSGEFTFEPVAQVLFERHYKSIQADESDTDVIRDFKSRQPSHILKVAMALSAATDDRLVITEFAMRSAIQLVGDVLSTLNIVFRGVGDSPLAQAQARIISYMERKGIASRNEILKDNFRHVTAEDLDRIIMILKDTNHILEVNQGGRKLFKSIK